MKKLLLALVCSAVFFGAKASPITLFNSLPGDNAVTTYYVDEPPLYSVIFASFTSDAYATLTDVILNLRADTPNDGGSLDVQLYDSDFNPIGEIGTINDSSLTATPYPYTVYSADTLNLSDGSQYWVLLFDSSTFNDNLPLSSAAWDLTDTWSDPAVTSENFGDGYDGFFPNSGIGLALEMQVNAETPEPSAFFLGFIGLALLAAFRYRRVAA